MARSPIPPRRVSLAYLAMSALAMADICAEEPSIQMRLAWPTEREAQVEAVRTWEIKGAALQPKPTLRVKYALRVLKVADGYEADIANVDFTIDGKNANNEEMVAIAQGLVLFGRADSEGRFLEFFDFDHLQKSVQDAYREKFKGQASASKTERLIARATSREVLQSEADGTWSTLVGDWVGSDFRTGVPQNKSLIVFVPFLDQSYRLDGQAVVSKYEKCLPTAATATCVRLKFAATPDPAALKGAIKRGVESLGESIDDLAWTAGHVDARFELELLTDPHTLTPYWARWSRQVTINSDTGGAPATTSKEMTTFAFNYVR
jgi:hypothetical protein